MDSSKVYWLIGPKAYWSFLKTFLITKKIPGISPQFHSNKFISNFRGKADLFNNFFAQQCTLTDNASEILAILYTKTTKTFSSIPVTRPDIAIIIKNLLPNKAHGHDMMSMQMRKLCGDSVLPSLELMFKSCLESGTFLSDWKKTNVVPMHRKGDNPSLKNYATINFITLTKTFADSKFTF